MKNRITTYLPLLCFFVVLAIATLYSGSQFDYAVHYSGAWQFVLQGLDPWRADFTSVHPPLAYLIAPLILIHPLFPKLLFFLSYWLIPFYGSSKAIQHPPITIFQKAAHISLWINPHYFFFAFILGCMDITVTTATLAAYLLFCRKFLFLSGTFLGLAVALKYYPLLLAPFFFFLIHSNKKRFLFVFSCSLVPLTSWIASDLILGYKSYLAFYNAVVYEVNYLSVFVIIKDFVEIDSYSARLSVFFFGAVVLLANTYIAVKRNIPFFLGSTLNLLLLFWFFPHGHFQYLCLPITFLALHLANTSKYRLHSSPYYFITVLLWLTTISSLKALEYINWNYTAVLPNLISNEIAYPHFFILLMLYLQVFREHPKRR